MKVKDSDYQQELDDLQAIRDSINKRAEKIKAKRANQSTDKEKEKRIKAKQP